ncbi:MAG TPA: hypothetical protein VFM31_07125 [Nitrososphaeraceae archaeon]|jgi:hypothetical protein|nr:hypothetical protein [Nitrososphaeraceae archaeon]
MIDSDWIKLLVKFKGKCIECQKQISAGEYALWSKSSKKIKHLECNTNNKNINIKSIEKTPETVLCCSLCDKAVENLSSDYLLNDSNQRESIAICETCLENPNSYLKYQEIIHQKIKKIVKLKF